MNSTTARSLGNPGGRRERSGWALTATAAVVAVWLGLTAPSVSPVAAPPSAGAPAPAAGDPADPGATS